MHGINVMSGLNSIDVDCLKHYAELGKNANYSNANELTTEILSDTTKLSQVTRWFRDMYLQTPTKNNINDLAQEAGSLPADTPVMNCSELSPKQRLIFLCDFLIMASNPVGRMLLYRLLIEIYRKDGVFENVPELDNISGVANPSTNDFADTELRKKARNIKIKWNEERGGEFSHEKDNAEISIAINNVIYRVQEVYKVLNKKSVFVSSSFAPPMLLYTTIFHEMNHWFDLLRHFRRQDRESDNSTEINFFGEKVFNEEFFSVFTFSIAEGTSERDEKKLQISALPWKVSNKKNENNSKIVVDYGEMKCILGNTKEHDEALLGFKFYGEKHLKPTQTGGLPILRRAPEPRKLLPSCYFYLFGDELSENAFRRSLGYNLRLGHKTGEFVENIENFYRAVANTNWVSGVLKLNINVPKYNSGTFYEGINHHVEFPK
jgi:hypothetical protein